MVNSDNILELVKHNSLNSIKDRKDYQEETYNRLNKILLRASEYNNVTGVFLAQASHQSCRIF